MTDVSIEFLEDERQHVVALETPITPEIAADLSGSLDDEEALLYVTYHSPEKARDIAQALLTAATVVEELRRSKGVVTAGGEA